ncbi:hypothetical protein HD597_002607 [Nonomuraea thailandensis]|uniref:Uncharacterized protein n=1 Tax=Nonomuraea thailandensis TaxID=1188745 RepID=A0A9X2GDD0_9ACTN|nr:hypothetical protein [Nonomuraea thailandensis]
MAVKTVRMAGEAVRSPRAGLTGVLLPDVPPAPRPGR